MADRNHDVPLHRLAGAAPTRMMTAGSLVAIALTAAGALAQDSPSNVETTRVALQKWVETRRIISKEKRDWQVSKELLNDRIDIVKREAESLHAKIATAKSSIADADEKRVEMVAENSRLKQAAKSLDETVNALEARTVSLLKRVPNPLRERVRPLSQRIPDDPKKTKLSLSERFQNIVGVLNEVNKFNREITIASEVLELGNGATAEVTTLYVGIGQGYYASAKGDAGGVGVSSADGWVWTPANDAAADIVKAIAILKNEQTAEFVLLPIDIK